MSDQVGNQNVGFLMTGSYVDIILKPYMESLPLYAKDTSDFITKIHNLKEIAQNSCLVTLDITSLYRNNFHNYGIKACDHFMSEGGKSQEARSVISKLINLVLTKIIFSLIMKIIYKF